MAALVDVIAITAPPILTHALLDWTVLAWIVAAQIVVLLALFLATVGRTPGLMLVSAVVMRPPTGTPGVGQALARVILTPLLPLQRRITLPEGDCGAVVATPGLTTAEKTTVLDVLTRTSTTTSRPTAQTTDPQNSTAASGAPALAATATPTTPVHGAGAYATGVTSANAAYAPPAGPAYGTQDLSSGVGPAPAPPRTELPRSFPPVGSSAPGPTATPILTPGPGAPVTAPFPTSANAQTDGEAASPRSSTSPLYRIVINSTRRLPLEGQCVLGREPRALMPQDVQLVTLDASTSVSRSHLRVGVAGAGPWVEDLGSANGSVLLRPDGTQAPLAPGIRTPLGPGGTVLLAEAVHLAIEASRRARRAQQSA